MKKLILSIVFLILLSGSVFAAKEDQYSWSWWSNKAGLTTGSINDIMNQYLTSLGYTGHTTDMFHKWLADQTSQSTTLSTNDLAYIYFVVNNSTGTGSNLPDKLRITIASDARTTTGGDYRITL